MNTGFGFSEMLLVLVLVVVFFGSKELPAFLREIAKFTAKVRRYSDRIKRELDEVTRSLDPQPVPPFADQQTKKEKLRTRYLSARKNLGGNHRNGARVCFGERCDHDHALCRHGWRSDHPSAHQGSDQFT